MLFHRYENWQSYVIYHPVVTTLVIVILFTQLLTYLLGEGPADIDTAYQFGALVSSNHSSEEWFRLITSLFVQMGGMYHLLWNIVCLMILGPPLERLLGHTKFILLYFVSGIGGGVFVLMFSANMITAGASASIYGLIGFYLGLIVQQNREVSGRDKNFIIVLFLWGVASVFLQSDGSIAAPLGGLFTGFILTSVLYSTTFQRTTFHRRERSPLKVLIALSVMIIVIVMPKYVHDHPFINGVEDGLKQINSFSISQLAEVNEINAFSEGRQSSTTETTLTEDIDQLISHYSNNALTLSNEASVYIQKNHDEFIHQTAQAIESVRAMAAQPDIEQINQDLTSYTAVHTSFQGKVHYLEEFDYGRSMVTYAVIMREKFVGQELHHEYFTVILLGRSGDLVENDHVTFYGFPVGTYAIDNTSGEQMLSHMFLGSFMEKRQ